MLKLKIRNLNKISTLYLFLSFFFLLIVIVKSELFFLNIDKINSYIYHYFFSLLLFLISIISFKLKKEAIKKSLITFLSVLISLLLVEIYITTFGYQVNKFISETGWDEYKKLKNINISARPQNLPFNYLDKFNIDTYPLSNHKNSLILSCNENGYFQTYFSDRFGFNNPDTEWDNVVVDYLIIGDSFAEGQCVNRPLDYASQLRIRNNKVITLGMGGNGPLLEYASLVEYGKIINIKNIIWMYFEDNDLNDLEKEIKHPILKSYFENPNYTQNLAYKSKLIDQMADNTYDGWLSYFNEVDRLNNPPITKKLLKIVFFTNLRLFIINHFFKKKKIEKDNKISLKQSHFNNFEKIINLINNFSIQNNAELYFVYVPGYLRYYLNENNNDNFKSYDKIKKLIETNHINFVDFYNYFKKEENPKKTFYSKDKYIQHTARHFSEEGYSYLAEKTDNFIKKK